MVRNEKMSDKKEGKDRSMVRADSKNMQKGAKMGRLERRWNTFSVGMEGKR